MDIKFFQLNIERGNHLDAVIAYIKKGNFDVVCLQEVAAGQFSIARRNCYEELLKKIGYSGLLNSYIGATGDIASFIGNATFYNNTWKLLANHVIWLKRYQEVEKFPPRDVAKIPRSALAMLLERSGKQLMVVNTHLAWGPTPNDAVYKKNQAEKLYLWLKTHIRAPFILAGDFNLNPHTVIVTRLSRLGNNLIKQYKITNTLNPRTHRAKNLFPSGLPVDYVITDRRIRVKNFFVEEAIDLSDHFGLVLECDV